DDLKPHLITSIIMAIETRHIDAKAVYDQWYGEFDEKRKNFKRQSLATAAARHGISTAGAHRALADCLMIPFGFRDGRTTFPLQARHP
ncbi:hypothetical protein RSW97_25400, partial [Escherichia coli]|nr:hypothetical protein [Escherichia coli]